MKTVSFEVAKALKKAGYPQGETDKVYSLEKYMACFSIGELYDSSNSDFIKTCDAPNYIDVWLWLWREKKHYIKILPIGVEFCWQILAYESNEWHSFGIPSKNKFQDPEEAINAAIEYLANNDLIKNGKTN